MSVDFDSAPRGAKARVLVIERDPSGPADLASALAECFVQAPELEVAPGGRAGSELLRGRAHDLVLADIASLADLSAQAEDAIARLARLSGEALTVVLSGDASVSSTVAAMRAGAHDCLAKPIDAAVLAARIAALALRHGKALDLRMPPEVAVAAEPPAAGVPVPRAPVLPMWQQEQRIIEEAIASFAGNISLAAAALQLSPSTIYRKRAAWAEAAQDRRGAA